MKTLSCAGSTKLRLSILALLTAVTLFAAPEARAAERDGTVLFFPFEDIQRVLTNPSVPAFSSFFSLSQPTPSLGWRAQHEVGRNGFPQRNTRDGNGFWADGYRLPGPRPLWGY